MATKTGLGIAAGILVVGAAGLGLWMWLRAPAPRALFTVKDPRSHAAQAAEKERRQGDVLYGQAKWRDAQVFYRGFVQKHAADKDPEVQDEVGSARLHLGYAVSKTDGYAKAREVFQVAAASYGGTGKENSDFGNAQDQAAYQASVCLEAAGRKDEARKEFLSFLKNRPRSPLLQAVYRRLKRLNGGKTTPEYDRLFQESLDKQQKWIRFETSTCGPKCVEYLLKALGKKSPTYTELAKLCGTTDKGTSLDGMRRCMKARGIPGYGFLVNRKDFAGLPLPAVWLSGEHYVVLLRFEGKYAVVYDPSEESERPVELPPLDNTAFEATVLTLQAPHLGVKS